MDSIVYQIEESNVANNHESYCPELLIPGFSDTAEEARIALRREIGIYLEDCETLGVLDEVLIEAGFYDDDEVWMSSLVTPPKEPEIRFV